MKKRTKKYNPQKHRIEYRPDAIARIATYSGFLNSADIDKLLKPYADAVSALKAGTMNESLFWLLTESNYLAIRTAEMLLHEKKFSDDESLDFLARMEVRDYFETGYSSIGTVLNAITERKDAHGRFVASGDELREMETFIEATRSLYALAPVRVIYAAETAAARVISDIRHKIRKRKAA